jgi:hypothetical protein
MKIWEEDDIVEKLATTSDHSRPWLLMLATRVDRHYHHYDFIYYLNEKYEALSELFEKSQLAVDDSTGASKVDSVAETASLSEGEDDEEKSPDSVGFESCYVAKALFNTVSGEPLLMIQGSAGWKEACERAQRIKGSSTRRAKTKLIVG